MKHKLKSNKDEKAFAVKHITDYYSYNSKCKYSDSIDSILDKFENNIIEYDQLKTNNESENMIIKALLSAFKDKLYDENRENPTGLFGVKRAFFTDGTNFYYKDLIKDEFVKVHPIYARNLKELKTKVKSNKCVWMVFDEKKYGKLLLTINDNKIKSNKKSSKGYSGSKKTGGIPRPIYHSPLASEIHNSYGRQ